MGTLITRFVIFHGDWSSGSRLSSMSLQWSFRYLVSWWVTER